MTMGTEDQPVFGDPQDLPGPWVVAVLVKSRQRVGRAGLTPAPSIPGPGTCGRPPLPRAPLLGRSQLSPALLA